jgi:hypothetical protein
VSDLEALGVESDAAARFLSDTGQQAFEVFPENWEALKIFLDCGTQWVYAPQGRVIGLNYPAVESVMRLRRVRDRGGTLDRLREMESAALNLINRKR